jgi:hypothetical protein
MDPEQIPDSIDATMQRAFAAQQSWFSLSVVGTPTNETLGGKEALRRSAQLMAALADELGLVLLSAFSPEPRAWTPELAAELQRGELSRVVG